MSNEIPDLYRVKYRQKGGRKWRFGTVEKYNDEAKKAWISRRLLLVNDAVYPVSHWVDYDNSEVVAIPFGHWDPDNLDEYDQHIENESQKHKARAAASTTLKDKIFHVGVADGCASYVIVKENKKTVKVEWRNFGGDAYYDAFMGMGGTFDKSRIEPFVNRTEGLAALFARGRR